MSGNTVTRRGTRARALLTVLTALTALVGGAMTGAAPASGSTGERQSFPQVRVASGVEYTEFSVPASQGAADAHLLTVDLTDPDVSVDLLYPGAVGARAPVSELADQRGAVAAVNGDFFDISEAQHPGVQPTGAPDGPAVADGRPLKAAVPYGQRFGPVLPPGATPEDVIGVGADGRGRIGRLELQGAVLTPDGARRLNGLNQYAVPVGGIGAFTSDWGSASRVRAVCGTDTDRAAPCSTDTYEVTVRRGRVTQSAEVPGSGPIPRDAIVLVGREAGARELRTLSVGDPLHVAYRLVASASRVPFGFALGGFPVLRGGAPLDGLDTQTAAVRTAAGLGDDGRTLYLLALDGGVEHRPGLTISELAALMGDIGADDAVDLDGGGSTTLVTRDPGAPSVTVRNHPTGGAERPVPNAIGVFSRP